MNGASVPAISACCAGVASASVKRLIDAEATVATPRVATLRNID